MTEQTTENPTTEPQEPAQEPTEVQDDLRDSNKVRSSATSVDLDDVIDAEEPDTFPRDYVERLRDENAKYRQRAQRADDFAHRLHTALVAATGRLADPGDLDFDEAHIDDEGALRTALDDLLARKPHLASRRPRGDVGQGVTGTSGAVDLAGLLRSRA